MGGLLSGVSWVLASQVESLWGLIGGIGTGIVYVGVVGRWSAGFPTAAASPPAWSQPRMVWVIATTFPIANSLAVHGHQATLLRFGVIFAGIGLLAALGLRPPATDSVSATQPAGSSTRDMLRSPVFWLMFVMMSLMSTSGLMATSQIGAIAADAGVAKATVWGIAALPLALTIDRFCNGLTRPFFGWLSDRLGREQTMCLAFALEGAAMTLWLLTRTDPVLFVLLSGVVFFGWGEIFSLFPSTLTDTFGARNATRNYLYIAQGIGAIFGGPLATLLHEGTGSWTPVFACAIAADLATALLAIAVLRPMRHRLPSA